MRLFHEAARVAFTDLRCSLSKLQEEPSLQNVRDLEAIFNDFMRSTAIHKNHEDKALYPALSASIHTRMAHKNYTPSLELLVNGLTEIPSFSEEHKEDHEAVARMQSLLQTLKTNVSSKEADADTVRASLGELTQEVTGWITFHEEHLQHEEKVMSPLMKGIASTLHMKVAIARTLLIVDRQGTISTQFPFVLSKLLRVKDWFCPMTKHKYSNLEILVVYINCFRMMMDNEKDYAVIVNIAKQIMSKEQWKEIQAYGLGTVK